MQGQINTLHGYFSLSVEKNHSMCRRIITNLVTLAIVEPCEFTSDILDELLTLFDLKLCLVQNKQFIIL